MKTFLSKLIQENIHISLDEGELSVKIPKEGVDPSIIEEIKSKKQGLVEYLENLKRNDNLNSINVKSIPKSDHYLISNAQQRLWVLNQFEEQAKAYNIFTQIELKGTYNISAFEQALFSAIERHEILRTIFKEVEGGEVRQFVLTLEELNFNIDFQDFRDCDNPEAITRDYIENDFYKPYNLSKGPLLRASLIHVFDDKYVFYINMHHIISDGRSLQILSRDVIKYYEAYMSEITVDIKPLKIQYKDYSTWQFDQLSKPEYQKHEKYWLNRFSGDVPKIDLPSQKIRPKVKTSNGKNLSTFLSKKISNQMNEFTQSHQGSLFMLTLSLLNVLLYKYTSNKSIIIGSPVEGRSHPDLEDQIGFYVNVLALRNIIDPSESFVEFYNRVKENTLQDFGYQEYPYDKLVEVLEVSYDTSRTSLYDISLTFHESNFENDDQLIDENLSDTIECRGVATSKNDVEFHFIPLKETVLFEVIFNKDVYETEMIETLMKHFKSITTSLLSNPKQAIGDIQYLSNEEKSKLLEFSKPIETSFNIDTTLVSLFEDQALNSPSNIALSFGEKHFTYKELNVLSNRLAHTLKSEYNIQVGDFVGVQLTRSEWSIISILGIMKAGGVYIPIDFELPLDRKTFILNDTNLKLLITETSFIFDLDFYDGAMFSIDIELDTTTEFDYQKTVISPQDSAYIIYTSGSTGNPKGVVIQHSGIVNTILSQIHTPEIKECKNSIQFSSFSFDASIWEIFISLLSGGRLFILDNETRKDARLFEKYIITNEIEIATLPPAFLKMVDISSLRNLKVLITAGEAAVQNKVTEYLKYGTFYNAYGPTETSICATMFKIEKNSQIDLINIPIGKPIANTQVYILDEYLNLCNVGVTGELYVSGNGLAREYWNRKDLTFKTFVPNPYCNEGLMYKTGDLVKWLPDGNIEYVGRVDDQVKIRGFRIELGEIEGRLLDIEGVDQSVVVLREELDNKYLVVYYVSEKGLAKEDILSKLHELLPDYMVPNYYIKLNSIPLTTNGKVDKKSLPNIEHEDLIRAEYIAPRNKLEEQLVEIWQRILEVEKIGINDNFFALGGHSLKLLRLNNEYHKQFDLSIDIKELHEKSDIKSTSEYIEFLIHQKSIDTLDLNEIEI